MFFILGLGFLAFMSFRYMNMFNSVVDAKPVVRELKAKQPSDRKISPGISNQLSLKKPALQQEENEAAAAPAFVGSAELEKNMHEEKDVEEKFVKKVLEDDQENEKDVKNEKKAENNLPDQQVEKVAVEEKAASKNEAEKYQVESPVEEVTGKGAKEIGEPAEKEANVKIGKKVGKKTTKAKAKKVNENEAEEENVAKPAAAVEGAADAQPKEENTENFMKVVKNKKATKAAARYNYDEEYAQEKAAEPKEGAEEGK